MRRALALLAAAVVPVTGGGAFGPDDVVVAAPGADWRRIATEDDRQRVRRWRDSWRAALAEVARGPDAGRIAASSALFDPDAALPDAEPPPGDYSCRTIKLGRQGAQPATFTAYPAGRCRIARDAGRLRFTRLTGDQRFAGLIFPDIGRRSIFLGTLILADETRALRYGRDRERDLVAIIDRIGDGRWRMAFPNPHFESRLDVVELTRR